LVLAWMVQMYIVSGLTWARAVKRGREGDTT